ncbi:MAG: hypothetical protein JWM59_1093 [Verrucomicrobiales bacterium]|nr:hypothetical protein [Verrucomicrobiales bacterium]
MPYETVIQNSRRRIFIDARERPRELARALRRDSIAFV